MITTKQWGFELENSQLCQSEHVRKMFAYIHVLHSLSLTSFLIASYYGIINIRDGLIFMDFTIRHPEK